MSKFITPSSLARTLKREEQIDADIRDVVQNVDGEWNPTDADTEVEEAEDDLSENS